MTGFIQIKFGGVPFPLYLRNEGPDKKSAGRLKLLKSSDEAKCNLGCYKQPRQQTIYKRDETIRSKLTPIR